MCVWVGACTCEGFFPHMKSIMWVGNDINIAQGGECISCMGVQECISA